jgi:hypothetical protein
MLLLGHLVVVLGLSLLQEEAALVARLVVLQGQQQLLLQVLVRVARRSSLC